MVSLNFYLVNISFPLLVASFGKVYLEVRTKGGQNYAMARKLLSSTAQGHVTEGVVEPHAVEALQDCAGVPGLYKPVVLDAQRN